MLDDALMTDSTEAWIARLSGKVPVSPVFDIAEALENPFVHERDGVVDYDYGDGRAARMIANPIRVGGEALPHHAAPRMGEHNVALLREAGFSETDIARLHALGVIANPVEALAEATL